MGRDAKVLDVLEDAAGRVAPGLKGQPEVEAGVRDTLSESFYYLGKYDRAREQAEAAVVLHEKAFSRDALVTLKSMDNLVAALIGEGRFPEAEKLGREVVSGRSGPPDPKTRTPSAPCRTSARSSSGRAASPRPKWSAGRSARSASARSSRATRSR
jgi:hypothetical protein